ncbi:MAG: hypothetical protein OXH42_03215 [Acidimicrobiaceae bacterium]|nr:hypothetical protein [Acidimicrobiaceae bacterium]
MPVGRPPQQEMPQIVRQIPRTEPLDAVEAPEEPPADPPEPFFWTRPSEPEPGTLRPIRALIGDTFRFTMRQWSTMLLVAVPAAALVVFAGLVSWAAYEQLVAPTDASRRSIAGFALISMVSGWVTALGIYFQTIAVAFLVRQQAQSRSMQSGAACAWALRRLPRVVTANVVYGLLVAAVFGAPLVFLGLYLSERDIWLLQPWTYLIAGVLAYTAPQINIYFSALKLEERRPKFRWARKLCRGRAGAIWGRVLLWQLVYVVFLAMWQIVAPEPRSVGSISLSVIYLVVPGAILTTAYTHIYADLAGIARDGKASVSERGTGDILQVPTRT